MKLTYKNSFYKNIEKFLNSMSLLSLIFMFTAFSILIINDLKFENNVKQKTAGVFLPCPGGSFFDRKEQAEAKLVGSFPPL